MMRSVGKTVFVAAAIAIHFPLTPAGAQDGRANEPLDRCVRIGNDLDRLACYDKAAGRTPAALAIEKDVATAGAWRIRQEASKITDEKTVFMTVESKDSVSCNWSRNSPVRLTIRCLENTTALIFSTECHMTSSSYNDYGDVDLRLDDGKAFVSSMVESTNSRSLGLWTGGSSIPVIKKFFGKKRLLARMTPYGESPFTAEFNIAGTELQIEPLRKACSW